MSDLGKLIDINATKGLPRKYRFHPFTRWFTLILGSLISLYSLWLIFAKITADSTGFYKFLPFAILFLSLNSVLKNLFTLNVILFQTDSITFRYLGKKSFKLHWQDIKKMEFSNDKFKQIILKYAVGSEEKSFAFAISFPNMLEIVNSIAEMCPEMECDDFMKNVIVSPKEKEKYARQQTHQD
ncbi:MAG TPA: hypothetical protein PLD62_05935 [Candidatus Cloacimonadota bacterium]|nr:hypothetical protein [Candidatus Cloacimonadota bacterium]